MPEALSQSTDEDTVGRLRWPGAPAGAAAAAAAVSWRRCGAWHGHWRA